MYFLQNWISKLLSEKNKVPEHYLKLERWQGPPNINSMKIYCSFKVSMFIELIQSLKQRKSVYLDCLG